MYTWNYSLFLLSLSLRFALALAFRMFFFHFRRLCLIQSGCLFKDGQGHSRLSIEWRSQNFPFHTSECFGVLFSSAYIGEWFVCCAGLQLLRCLFCVCHIAFYRKWREKTCSTTVVTVPVTISNPSFASRSSQFSQSTLFLQTFSTAAARVTGSSTKKRI